MSADGLLIVDKPAGWTSHDVVARCRRLAQTRKVGHAGTLDPMATGVLVVGAGRATKLLGHLSLTTKAYSATVRLGESTLTDDADGETTAASDATRVTRADVLTAMQRLTGDIHQRPSSVSAIKIKGERAYKRVREGEEVRLPERPVSVARFDLDDWRTRGQVVDLDVTVECSTGTYVRALARDLGEAVGVGGHLVALRRTRVGAFGLAEARTLEALAAQPAEMVAGLSLDDAVRRCFATRVVDAATAARARHGQPVPAADLPEPYGVLDDSGLAVGLYENRAGMARPTVVFPPLG